MALWEVRGRVIGRVGLARDYSGGTFVRGGHGSGWFRWCRSNDANEASVEWGKATSVDVLGLLIGVTLEEGLYESVYLRLLSTTRDGEGGREQGGASSGEGLYEVRIKHFETLERRFLKSNM